MADEKTPAAEKLKAAAAEMPAAGPHDAPELTNKLKTSGTGMLPETGKADDDDMAPGG